jgi:predicted membrane protein
MYIQNRNYILLALAALSIGILVTSNIVFPLASLCLALLMLYNEPRRFFKYGIAQILTYFFDSLNCIEANLLWEIISFACAMYMCVQMMRNIYNNNHHDHRNKKRRVFASLSEWIENFIYEPQVVRA